MKSLAAFIIFILLAPFNAASQQISYTEVESIPVFRDTVGPLAFDSIFHRMVTISQPVNFHIEKKLKNIGKVPVIISSTFTSDPHFICDYPREPILPGRTYSFKVCFTFPSIRQKYHWQKIMGFVLSDSTIIQLHFEGEVVTAID